MTVSPKLLEEFKQIAEKEGYKFKSEEEAREAADRLASFAEIILDIGIRDLKRKERLKKMPKGFLIDEDGTYNCRVCYTHVSKGEGWYDRYGFKCMFCQKALEKKVIPVSVVKNRDSWMASWQLQDKLKLHPATIRKVVREGKLKPRIIKNTDGKDYYYIFIIKENKDFLLNFLKGKKDFQ